VTTHLSLCHPESGPLKDPTLSSPAPSVSNCALDVTSASIHAYSMMGLPGIPYPIMHSSTLIAPSVSKLRLTNR
jgi:hypothetical protein